MDQHKATIKSISKLITLSSQHFFSAFLEDSQDQKITNILNTYKKKIYMWINEQEKYLDTEILIEMDINNIKVMIKTRRK